MPNHHTPNPKNLLNSFFFLQSQPEEAQSQAKAPLAKHMVSSSNMERAEQKQNDKKGKRQ